MNKLRKSYSPGGGGVGGWGWGLVLVKFKEWSKPFNMLIDLFILVDQFSEIQIYGHNILYFMNIISSSEED